MRKEQNGRPFAIALVAMLVIMVICGLDWFVRGEKSVPGKLFAPTYSKVWHEVPEETAGILVLPVPNQAMAVPVVSDEKSSGQQP